MHGGISFDYYADDSVIPIHLLELAPEHFRSFVVGTSYQLGNLASSASSTIEATVGERFPLSPLPNGLTRYDYGKVMAIFMGCVYTYLIILTMVGPEARKVDHVKEQLDEPMKYDGRDDGSYLEKANAERVDSLPGSPSSPGKTIG